MSIDEELEFLDDLLIIDEDILEGDINGNCNNK